MPRAVVHPRRAGEDDDPCPAFRRCCAVSVAAGEVQDRDLASAAAVNPVATERDRDPVLASTAQESLSTPSGQSEQQKSGSSQGSVSGYELPELSDGALWDMDIDTESWKSDSQEEESAEATEEPEEPPRPEEPQVLPRSEEPEELPRPGEPGGITPHLLASVVLASPVVSPEIVAQQMTLQLVDPDDRKAVLYAARAAASTEVQLMTQVLEGLQSALLTSGPQGAYMWLQTFAAIHRRRPQ